MDVLDYMERESADTLRELMRDYAASFDRAVKLATALAGGSAALLAYAPGAPLSPGLRWVLLGVAVVWALAAGVAVVKGAVSNYLQSGASVLAMQDRYLDSGGTFVPYTDSSAALLQVRLGELNRRQQAALGYTAALDKRAKAINVAIVCAALAPLVGALAALILSGF